MVDSNIAKLAVAAVLAACVAAQPAHAVEDGGFAFDPAKCSFGGAIDAEFAQMQAEHDAGLEATGFRFRDPDEERGQHYELDRKFAPLPGMPPIATLSISFEGRFVYFDADLSEIEQLGVARGFYRPGEGGYLGHIVLPDGSEAERGSIFSTADYAYSEKLKKTVAVFDPRGRSGIGCFYPEAQRLADAAGTDIEGLAAFRPDKAVWTRPVASAFKAAEDARAAGDFDSAALSSRKLLDLLDGAGAGGTGEYAVALNSHGKSLSGLGRKREALALFERARDLSANVYGLRHPRTTMFAGDYAVTLNTLQPGDTAWWQLFFVYRQMSELFGEDDPRTIAALNAHGVATGDIVLAGREEMLEMDDARTQLERALEKSLALHGPNHPDTLTIRFNLGLVLDKMDEPRAALEAVHAAVQGRYRLYGAEHPATLQAVSAETDQRLRLDQFRARALVPAQIVANAWRKRRATLATGARDEAQRAREQREQSLGFARLVEASWWTADADPSRADGLRRSAFEAVQEAMSGRTDRAVALMAARRAAEQAGAGLGDLAARRQALADEWSAIEQRLTFALGEGGAGSADLRQRLSARQAAVEKELASIDAQLGAKAPSYFAFTRPEPLDLDEARAMLGPDEAVLLVLPTAYGTHVMALTHDGVTWHRSDWEADRVNASVRRLLWDVGGNVTVTSAEEIAWSKQGKGAYPYDRGTAFALYSQLVAPVASALEGKTHLFVAAGGSLSSLPFGILVTEPPQGEDGDPAALRATGWFADAHALVQIPSLQALRLLRMAEDSAGDGGERSFTGFGDPVLAGQAEQRGGRNGARRSGPGVQRATGYFMDRGGPGEAALADVESLRSLARLPGTASEIARLAEAFGAGSQSQFTGARATEGNFRQLDLTHVGVLALATHGLVAGELDGYSEPGLVFTPPAQPSPQDDGLLTTSEIAALDIDADWVILSACNTAAGDGDEGAPGLSGLARAFFYAGARNLLASHWPVRDNVAPRITVRTVEIARANSGMSRAQAFQQAMREVRMDPSGDSEFDTLAHPNAWAPFVIVGDK